MVLRVMIERNGEAREGHRRIEARARCRGELIKVVREVGEFSGAHGAQKTDASAVGESGMGIRNAMGKPTSHSEGPSVQTGVCDVGCGTVER